MDVRGALDFTHGGSRVACGKHKRQQGIKNEERYTRETQKSKYRLDMEVSDPARGEQQAEIQTHKNGLSKSEWNREHGAFCPGMEILIK